MEIKNFKRVHKWNSLKIGRNQTMDMSIEKIFNLISTQKRSYDAELCEPVWFNSHN